MKKNTEKKDKKGRKYVSILGIKVISANTNELLTGVEKNISCNTKFSIMTPNPELVLMAQKNKKLRDALNSADYAVPDGVGLSYASKFLFGKSLNIIPGRKLFDELIKLSVKKHWKVFLLGGLGDEAKIASQKLQITNLKLQIKFDKFTQLDQFANPVTEVDKKLQKDAIDKINEFRPHLLFVAFGNPKQELWIYDNLSKLKIGGAMAVGGTFRYIAGVCPLPPKWIEELGLEWLWRLVTEPKRVGRTFNAFPLFPLRVFIEKLRINF